MRRGSWVAALGVAAFVVAHAQVTDEKRWIAIARQAIVAEVEGRPSSLPDKSEAARPVFVTIEVGGVIRGCRGDLTSRARTLEEEIRLAARGATAHDPRYRTLRKSELKNFLVTVTLVDRVEPLARVEDLAPADGLVLTCGSRKGIVLPWEGKDPATRLKWAYRKAGIAEGTSVKLERLIARRFRG